MASTSRRRVVQMHAGDTRTASDEVAVEEPLTIEVNGRIVSTTMRTPGHDIELALGWLVSEGAIHSREDIADARECFESVAASEEVRRTVKVTTRDGRELPARLHSSTSACGICGSDVIEETVRLAPSSLGEATCSMRADRIPQLMSTLHAAQRGFAASGGLHAAALFDLEGRMICVREDVGRHNALDAVIGWALMHEGLPLRERVLVVTSRASAELAHKAVRAGAPFLVAVSAPTSLAIDLAREAGLTLVGFARADSFTVYAGEHRLEAV